MRLINIFVGFVWHSLDLLRPFPSVFGASSIGTFLFFWVLFFAIGAGPMQVLRSRDWKRISPWVMSPLLGSSLYLIASSTLILITRKFGHSYTLGVTFSLIGTSGLLWWISARFLNGDRWPRPGRAEALAWGGLFALSYIFHNSIRHYGVPPQFDGSTHTHLYLLMSRSGSYPDVLPFVDSASIARIFYGPMVFSFADLFGLFGFPIAQTWMCALLFGFSLLAMSIYALLSHWTDKNPLLQILSWFLIATPALYWNHWESGLPEGLSMTLLTLAFLFLFECTPNLLNGTISGMLWGGSFLAYPHMILALTPVALIGSLKRGARIFFTFWLSSGVLFLIWYFRVLWGQSSGAMFSPDWNFSNPIVMPHKLFPYFYGWGATLGFLALPMMWTKHLPSWIKLLILGSFLVMEYWIFLWLIPGGRPKLVHHEWVEFFLSSYSFKTFTRAPDTLVTGQVVFILVMPLVLFFVSRFLIVSLQGKKFSKVALAFIFSVYLTTWAFRFLVCHYAAAVIVPADLSLLTKWREQSNGKELILNRPWSKTADMWVGTLAQAPTLFWRYESGHIKIQKTNQKLEVLQDFFDRPSDPKMADSIRCSGISHVFVSAEIPETIKKEIFALPFLEIQIQMTAQNGTATMLRVKNMCETNVSATTKERAERLALTTIKPQVQSSDTNPSYAQERLQEREGGTFRSGIF